ncbi:helix-turn-helix transcriptional regulator [Lactobacillus helveticus]|uniref:helix-turn-helix domain-containing protein n=1 Tax=Lactobacillus helveticus TaxID=1587 RepID=UPI00374EBCF6
MIAFERIKKLAKQKKLSLVEVNDKAGLGTRSIYHWNKTQPSNSNLAAVAKVLGTTTDYLNGLTDDPSLPTDNSFSLDDDKPVMYHGYTVPDKYLDMIRGLMDADIKEGKADKHE